MYTYTDATAQARMSINRCPECGQLPSRHSGWGGPNGCTITDNGVAQRIHDYNLQQQKENNRGTD